LLILPGWHGIGHGRRKEGWLPPGSLTETEIRDWCIAYVKRTVADPSIAIGPDVTFPQMGLDSASSAYFVVELEEWLGIELDPEIVVDHPTIAQLAHHIVSRRLKDQSGGGNAGIA
jgi:acyl carrier protein